MIVRCRDAGSERLVLLRERTKTAAYAEIPHVRILMVPAAVQFHLSNVSLPEGQPVRESSSMPMSFTMASAKYNGACTRYGAVFSPLRPSWSAACRHAPDSSCYTISGSQSLGSADSHANSWGRAMWTASKDRLAIPCQIDSHNIGPSRRDLYGLPRIQWSNYASASSAPIAHVLSRRLVRQWQVG